MRVLLDTNALLWAVLDPDLLSSQARAAIEDVASGVFASAVSIWEISIKTSLGKLPREAPARVRDVLEGSRFSPLSITTEHAFSVRDLPWHHKDPFDRLLVVQARTEGLILVSSDRWLRSYDVDLLW